jgi:hypothetical protein
VENVLRWLKLSQNRDGSFPTMLVNKKDGIRKEVSTLTPTILICLLLTHLREKLPEIPGAYSSGCIIDAIIGDCHRYLLSVLRRDDKNSAPLWGFNVFYPPDWEETLLCSFILRRAGKLSDDDIQKIRELLLFNLDCPKGGVGVWVQDDHSLEHGNLVYDPIVIIVANVWHKMLFGKKHTGINDEAKRAATAGERPTFYTRRMKGVFWGLLCLGGFPHAREFTDDCLLFHHGHRKHVWYGSCHVWAAVNLVAKFYRMKELERAGQECSRRLRGPKPSDTSPGEGREETKA